MTFAGCDPAKLKDSLLLKSAAEHLPSVIGMEGFGEARLEVFGDPFSVVWGATAVQLLTTSHLAFHAAPNAGQFFLDITSCREFGLEPVVEYITSILGEDCHLTQESYAQRGTVTPEMIAACGFGNYPEELSAETKEGEENG